ncbi:DNA-3-methyladenine glycosylase 2 [Buttiauxella selenatireducens]|uniref:DNA-3-methyladenine glycosylase II n=1 Tax=Buttiauxella selenatireducens TaxID=3073902 RepID=A0ABY9SG88_9ENTR|nr:DNA-3-methyladenine glycosylase 2 [Buttiauxella sp. R73]WMY75855.1 DNA-3-methyladenine glycosylase 2 [Buttiauxella sp. R73]
MYQLDYKPPYDWKWMFGFLAGRAVSGIETVSETHYCRSFALDNHQGLLTLVPDEAACQLNVTLSAGLQPVASEVLQRIKQLLDLDCQPQTILESLGDLSAARPGLRLPGCMDTFEQSIRAILGQLVSVAMAAKLTSKLAQTFGEPLAQDPDWRLFPTPERLALLRPEQLKALGMPLKRGEAIIHMARLMVEGKFAHNRPADVEHGVKVLTTYPGIGRWTANYIALRGWQASDVFLPDDYLIKQRFPGMTPAQIRRYAERWKPWRSYALLHIWYSDGWVPSTSEPSELVNGKITGIQ